MNFSFEKQGTRTYLVYTVAPEEMLDSMSLGMITNNRIPGLTQAVYIQMDDTKQIKYDVTTKISVKQFFAGQVNRKRLMGVFNGITDALLSAEDYMLDINSIVMDMDYMFANVSTCETVLVCLPLISDDMSSMDLGTFFKNIMFSTQFDQSENCDHVAKIINYLNSAPVFSLEEFKKLLVSLDQPVQNMKPAAQNVQQAQAKQPAVSQQAKQPAAAQQYSQPAAAQQYSQPAAAQQYSQPAVPQQYNQPAVSQQAKQPAVPQQYTPPEPVGPQAYMQPYGTPPQSVAGEKKMTLFKLLCSYSKENAAIYKAQKEAEKNAAAKSVRSAPSAGFAVPGQDTPMESNYTSSAAQGAPQAAPQQTYMPTGQPGNFGGTVLLGGKKNTGTTVLTKSTGTTLLKQPAWPYLLRMKNNERIYINKDMFRIGREENYADYCIRDNTAVSGSHANIITRNGMYFLMDTNSSNGTYLNGQQIQINTEVMLEHGMKVTFADEAYEFRTF